MTQTFVRITLPNGEELDFRLGGDQTITINVNGFDLIGVVGDSGAGWWPTGDGGEVNGDWTPLRPNTEV